MDVVERYLVLGLRMGRHVDGLVDAYFGPAELAARVDAEELAEPAALVVEAERLLAEAEPETWLFDQLRGVRAYAGVLAGDVLYIKSMAMSLPQDTLDLVRLLCDVTLRMIEGEIFQLKKNGAVDITEE